MQFNRVIKHFVIHGSKVDKLDATEDWTSRGKHYSRLDTRFASSYLLFFVYLSVNKSWYLTVWLITKLWFSIFSLKHEAFMLGTSKTKHESGGFDLFITTAPIPDLNDKINVFGRVIKGEDIVQVWVTFPFPISCCIEYDEVCIWCFTALSYHLAFISNPSPEQCAYGFLPFHQEKRKKNSVDVVDASPEELDSYISSSSLSKKTNNQMKLIRKYNSVIKNT